MPEPRDAVESLEQLAGREPIRNPDTPVK